MPAQCNQPLIGVLIAKRSCAKLVRDGWRHMRMIVRKGKRIYGFLTSVPETIIISVERGIVPSHIIR